MSYKIIAIEGIDRIGKSTFIKALYEKVSKNYNPGKCRIEKPSIGLNTIDKVNYPLMKSQSIFAQRNIGLFEELLFQVNTHIKHNNSNTCIIRDRFHLSELCYGKILRPTSYEIYHDVFGFAVYEDWSHWFEQQLDATGANINLITFVLDDESIPNEDEVTILTPEILMKINKEFMYQHEQSKFKNKLLIKLRMVDGMTDIMSYVDAVYEYLYQAGPLKQ